MKKSYYLLITYLLINCILSLTSLHASSTIVEIESEKLKSTINETLDVMYSNDFNTKTSIKKEETIKNILINNYDLQIIIRRVMGRNWKKLNPKEQKKVSQLIIQLSIKNFIRGLEGKSRPLIKYGKTIQSTPKRVEIPITVIFNKNKIYNIEYRLGYLRTGWQIFDIIAEEISIVSNYRQQINDHFRKKNGTELIEKLNELLNKNNK